MLRVPVPATQLLPYLPSWAIFHSTLAFCNITLKKRSGKSEGTAKATSTVKNCMLSVYSEKEIFWLVTACYNHTLIRCGRFEKAPVNELSQIVEKKCWNTNIICFWTLSIILLLSKTLFCLHFKTLRFWDWILCPSSGETSFRPNW